MSNPPFGPRQFFVLFHAPGPKWQDGVGFREQPGIMEHAKYMAGFFGQGKMALGGPFTDNSGGMMVARVATMDEAMQIAEGDPCVKSGLLRVTIREWRVVFQNMD